MFLPQVTNRKSKQDSKETTFFLLQIDASHNHFATSAIHISYFTPLLLLTKYTDKMTLNTLNSYEYRLLCSLIVNYWRTSTKLVSKSPSLKALLTKLIQNFKKSRWGFESLLQSTLSESERWISQHTSSWVMDRLFLFNQIPSDSWDWSDSPKV